MKAESLIAELKQIVRTAVEHTVPDCDFSEGRGGNRGSVSGVHLNAQLESNNLLESCSLNQLFNSIHDGTDKLSQIVIAGEKGGKLYTLRLTCKR
jgi:hypothetical protein